MGMDEEGCVVCGVLGASLREAIIARSLCVDFLTQFTESVPSARKTEQRSSPRLLFGLSVVISDQ